ncbi:protein FAR1-RELATED SEQUENCE 1-like [Silene latifolia]|uniref:protein FAR1-RELATED SEQUENCE 1-like n=1 Tax=Silene latifolia TaxID=37657 RepID=UPI003D775CA2
MTFSVCEVDHMQIEVAVEGTQTTQCSCMMFERMGFLCRHIVWILSANGMKTIPGDYVSTRWRKDALQFRLSECDGEQMETNSSADAKEVAMVKLWSEVHATIGLLRGTSETEVVNLSSLIREFKEKLLPYKKDLTKQQEFEQILGCPQSDEFMATYPILKSGFKNEL